jgi:hypothetical protein
MTSKDNLFLVPELLGLVLEQSDTAGDVARLASTSHHMFDLCMPFAWRHVRNATQLLKLLPDVDVPPIKKRAGIFGVIVSIITYTYMSY